MKSPVFPAVQTILTRAPIYGRAAVRISIITAVFIGCILADLAVLSYNLGRQTGAAVHARNDQLAALAVRLLAPTDRPAPAPLTAPTIQAPIAAPPRPVVAVASAPVPQRPARPAAVARPMPAPPTDYSQWTVAQLRAHTGQKSKRLRKADLVRIATEADA